MLLGITRPQATASPVRSEDFDTQLPFGLAADAMGHAFLDTAATTRSMVQNAARAPML
jgi:hypothetical protein